MLVDHIVPGNIVHLTDVVEPEMVTPAPVITLVTSVEALHRKYSIKKAGTEILLCRLFSKTKLQV